MAEKKRVLFSDIDGTLAHYIDDCKFDLSMDLVPVAEQAPMNPLEGTYTCSTSQPFPDSTRVISLPPSSTGLQAWISMPTFSLIERVRKQHPFVLISGARTSTVLQRLPFLPKADAVVTENGGRIFLAHDVPWSSGYPLREDQRWRAMHMDTAGPATQEVLQPEERSGSLWDLYRTLHKQGWELDTKSYSTCIRAKNATQESLEQLRSDLPQGLTMSMNMGKADVYPATSGKVRAAAHLAATFGADMRDCAFMCDDDNDIELALAVGKAYCPTISSESIKSETDKSPAQFFVATQPFVFGTEEALQAVQKDWHGQAAAKTGVAESVNA